MRISHASLLFQSLPCRSSGRRFLHAEGGAASAEFVVITAGVVMLALTAALTFTDLSAAIMGRLSDRVTTHEQVGGRLDSGRDQTEFSQDEEPWDSDGDSGAETDGDGAALDRDTAERPSQITASQPSQFDCPAAGRGNAPGDCGAAARNASPGDANGPG